MDELTLRVRKLLDQRIILQKAYATRIGLPSVSEKMLGEEQGTLYHDIVIPQLENKFVKSGVRN
ncbi:MAG: hypothetical protein IPN79_19965 [Saprospiraceae bacterium]|nr:hypothetical protein [Saprospiraceae bacterium]